MKRRQRTLKEILHKRITLFILFYIMIITIYFTSVTLSKNAGQLDKNGQVSVARWHVEADLDEESIDIITGNEIKTCTVIINSNSEIANSYSIILTHVPDDLEIALDEQEFQTAVDGRIEFVNVGTISTSNNSEIEHVLKFQAPIEMNEEVETLVNIDVIFTQDEL